MGQQGGFAQPPSGSQPGFGHAPGQQPGFGQAPQPGHGQAPPPSQQAGFGQAPPQPGFGQAGQPGFGQAPQPGHGQAPQPSQQQAFGAPPQQPGFGQAAQPGLGSQPGQSPAMGGQPGFGSQPAAQQSSGGSGASVATGMMGGGLAGVFVGHVVQGKNPRMAGAGLVAIGLLLMVLNCVTIFGLDRWYPFAVAMFPPFILGGGFIAATGRPTDDAGNIPIWWKIGAGVAGGVGLLVGVVLAAAVGWLGG